MNNKSKNILIIVLIILLILACGVIGWLFYSKSNELHEISGKVIVAGSDYVIIDSNGEDYIISDMTDDFREGDEITISYKSKNLDKSANPKSIKPEGKNFIVRVEPRNDVESSEETENKTSSNVNNEGVSTKVQEPSTNNSNTSSSNNTNIEPPSNNSTSTESGDTDTLVLSYFNELDNDFKASTIKDSVKSGFITVVDFLFYDGKIKGHTFSELTDSAKLKVLSMAMYFDSKIEKYFPGYKESISTTTGRAYNKVKETVVKTYLNLTTKICENNEELCASAKNDFSVMKKSFGLTWSLIKEIASEGASNLKSWYEIYRGKSN